MVVNFKISSIKFNGSKTQIKVQATIAIVKGAYFSLPNGAAKVVTLLTSLTVYSEDGLIEFNGD